MAEPNSDAKRVKILENLLVIEIDRVVELMKKNDALEEQLGTIQRKFGYCLQHCDKKQKEEIRCDRSSAMLIHGEIDLSEVLG